MRTVVLAGLLAACGDNAPPCGHVELLVAYRNVWPAQLAVDATHVYHADYDVDGFGTKLLLRQPRDGGPLQGIASRPRDHRWGHGLVLDDSHVVWTADSEPAGHAVFATPREGGPTIEIAALPACGPRGLALTPSHVYAGRCEPSDVIAIDRETGATSPIWTAGPADGTITALAATADTVLVATTAGLFAVRTGATEALAGGAVYHLIAWGNTIYYSTDDAIYAAPLTGGRRDVLHAYAPGAEQVGAFGIDGDDLFVAEPPRIVHVSLAPGSAPARGPREIVLDLGVGHGSLVARDGHVYWSVLALPDTVFGPGAFAGGVLRASGACDAR